MEQLWGSLNLRFTATVDKGNSDVNLTIFCVCGQECSYSLLPYVIDTGMTSFSLDAYWRKLNLILVDVGA